MRSMKIKKHDTFFQWRKNLRFTPILLEVLDVIEDGEGYRGICKVRWHILETDKVYTSVFPMAVENSGMFYEFMPIPRKTYLRAIGILKEAESYKIARRRILYLVNKTLVSEMVDKKQHNMIEETMKKCPSVDELWPLLALGDNYDLNGNIVDDESLEVMLRIEKTMQRLKVMGSDDRRYLWIELQAPEDKEEWDDDVDVNGHVWYEFLTANYKGFHYLIMSNRSWRLVDLRSAHHVGAERTQETCFHDVKKPLLVLEKYVTGIVDSIVENADAYNDYVEQHLPYEKRDGTIKRSVLYSICPTYREFKNPQHYLDVINAMKAKELSQFKQMTLRIYMRHWRIAYEAYTMQKDYEPVSNDVFKDISDEEMFSRYSSKGREINGLDLDSEGDFIKWEKENSSYHCNDVAYARIHLWTEHDDNGLWHFTLGFNVTGFLSDTLHIVETFLYHNIGIDISHFADETIAKLSEEDEVTITPLPNKYAEEMWLPSPCENITEELVQEVIRHTKWVPQAKAEPLK